MSDQPDGRGLLEQARRTLLDKVLPALPKDQAYDVLMIANAMAIAARELAAGAAAETAEQQAIAAFFREAGYTSAQPASVQGLAQVIRARALPQGPALHNLLLTLTRSRLALGNPKYLHR